MQKLSPDSQVAIHLREGDWAFIIGRMMEARIEVKFCAVIAIAGPLKIGPLSAR